MTDEFIKLLKGNKEFLTNQDLLSIFYEERRLTFFGEDYLRKITDSDTVRKGLQLAKVGLARAKEAIDDVKGAINERKSQNKCCSVI